MLENGFNKPPMLSGNEADIEEVDKLSNGLNYLIYARDWVLSGQQETLGKRRDFIIVRQMDGGITEELWIKPKPMINRVGSGSKPFRLLGGQEVILSEDDVRVTGISKRYSLSQVWSYGVLYVMNPVLTLGKVNLDKSSVYELIFLDDSDPVSWTLNLRQLRDSRNYGVVPLIP